MYLVISKPSFPNNKGIWALCLLYRYSTWILGKQTQRGNVYKGPENADIQGI